MKGISTIGNTNHYRRRRLRVQNNIHYKNEYERLVGELSQANLPYDVRHTYNMPDIYGINYNGL